MRTRAQRRTSLAVCSILCGGLSLVGAVGTAGSAGATGVLSATPTSLNFGEVTLGDIVGGQSFTLTNNTGAIDYITDMSVTGPGDYDFLGVPDADCPVDALGQIQLAIGASCTVDVAFLPGALGERTATVDVADTADSGVTVGLSGVGGIGYYQVSAKGVVAHFGDAGFYGDLSNVTLNKPIVGIAQTGDDGGYWMAASDGGVFPFGDAQFYGSTGGNQLNKPIVGMAPTPDGGGYWLVASDGGIFSYGDAQFYGSTGSIHLAQPIVGVAPMPDGNGYWFTAADGGLFNYGSAPFLGAAASQGIGTVVGMATDGAPTLQAFVDAPSTRSHADGPVPLIRPLPANVRHFAGP